MDLTVIIAQRNEPELKRTIEAVFAACVDDHPQVLVVNDGEQKREKGRLRKGLRIVTPWKTGPKGCQCTRDAGIMESETEYVCIIDGHMAFEAGLFAAMLAHLEANPRDIVGTRCCHLGMPGWKKPDEPGYSGAYLLWADGRLPLEPKWRDIDTPEEVPCVLGACYGFRRDRYVDILRRPWQHGTGWGKDEEVLSIVNWLCGGRNIVIGKRAWHWFREQKQVTYESNAVSIEGRIEICLRLIEMLPLSDEWRAELVSNLKRDRLAMSQWKHVEGKVNHEAAKEMRAWLSAQERTFEQWRKLFCCDADPRPAHGGNIAARPGYMRAIGKANGTAPVAEPHFIGRREQVAMMPCPHGFNHLVAVVKQYPNGNKQMRCTDCNRMYIHHQPQR